MVPRAVAGLAGLALIGGVGAVTYNEDGTATVTITDKGGRTQTVKIEGDGGKRFLCPDGTEAKLEPVDVTAGRITITLRGVRKRMGAIEKRYPEHEAPGDVVRRYNRLIRRDAKLVSAYNDAIDRHNAILEGECEPE